jgi:lysozyme family protein
VGGVNIDRLIDDVLRREGGYSNDPDDPGGTTKYGITQATLRATGNTQNVRDLTKDQARAIYREFYWRKPRINLLPYPLQPAVFDFYVNSGKIAIETLQRLLREFDAPVVVDGLIGLKTAQASRDAIKRADKVASGLFVDAYAIARRNFLYNLADKRPSSRKFAMRRDGGKGGWIIRAEEFMSDRFKLSEAEHRRRVARWT